MLFSKIFSAPVLKFKLLDCIFEDCIPVGGIQIFRIPTIVALPLRLVIKEAQPQSYKILIIKRRLIATMVIALIGNRIEITR